MLAGHLLQILRDIVFPLFAIIGLGVVAGRAYHFDERTLSRLCFHFLLPPLIFVKVLESALDLVQLRLVMGATLLHLGLLLAFSRLLFGRGALQPYWPVAGLAVVFANCGNYGIPLMAMAFPDGGVGVMAGILMTQNLVFFSLGTWLAGQRGRSPFRMAADLLRVPVIDAILAALALRLLHLSPPPLLQQPLIYLAGGLVPVALMTLGLQLGRTHLTRNLAPLGLVCGARLGLSPLLAAGVGLLLGLEPPLFAIFVVAAGLPVAVNVYLLSAEYGLDSGLASQAIGWTTLLSALTLSLLLAALR